MANERLRDSGGWGDYRLPQIWDMVKDEDPVPTYQQVDAWQRMAALCTDQADVLQKALDQLMVRWPPNPGSAAEVFKGHVDTMIWSMRDSAAAASANVAPLIKIVTALSQAKDEIGALVQQHAAFQGVAEDGAGPTALEPWVDTLDAQARRIMALTDHKIGEAAADIRSPTLYRFKPKIDEPQPPPPPPPPPPPTPTRGVGPSDQRSTPIVPLPVFDPPPRAMLHEAESGADDVSPFLDGSRLFDIGDGPGNHGLGASTWFVSTPAGMALAPGGVIGGASASSPGPNSEQGANGQPGRAPGQTGATMYPPPMGRGVQGTSTTRNVVSGGRRRRRSDPDDPWTPPAGGPAVLEPSPEPDYFDPGPNVIGIDR
jgi:hypothetical protein